MRETAPAALNLEAIVQFIETVFQFKVLPPSIYYIDKFPSKVEPFFVVVIALISIGISFLATLYPSWRRLRGLIRWRGLGTNES